jgi:NitT/TauT family transport system permease protein
MRLINRKPDAGTRVILAALPFVLVVLAYVLGSAARLAENPADKLLPSLGTLGDAVMRVAFVADAHPL